MRFTLLCMKEPARRKRHRKNFAQFRRNCTEMELETVVEVTVLRKKLDYQQRMLRVCLLHPDCWSAIPVRTQGAMQLLIGTWQSHASLQVLKNTPYTNSEKAG